MSNIKYIQILFKPEMVNAILEGRKTQTRRLNCLKMVNKNPDVWEIFKKSAGANQPYSCYSKNDIETVFDLKQPYQAGNVLWVREQYCETSREYIDKISGLPYVYKASAKGPDADEVMKEFGWKWKPSIHMPKAACRIFLEITEVRVERLKDISTNDAIAEGINKLVDQDGWIVYHHTFNPPDSERFGNAIAAYKNLWNSINGANSWQANPFVWAITFKRIDKPANWPNHA